MFDEWHSDLVRVGKRIGVAHLNVVLDVLGGLKVHIPQRERFWTRLAREVRDEEIRARFRGNNVTELAQDYGLSDRSVHYILHGGRVDRRSLMRASRDALAVVDAQAKQNNLSRRMMLDALVRAAQSSPTLAAEIARVAQHGTAPDELGTPERAQ